MMETQIGAMMIVTTAYIDGHVTVVRHVPTGTEVYRRAAITEHESELVHRGTCEMVSAGQLGYFPTVYKDVDNDTN